MKKKFVYVGSCLALFLLSGFDIFFSTGIVGVTQKPNHIFGVPGCICHGDTTSLNVTAWIEGPETLHAGEQALFRMYVRKDSLVAAGFNVASFFGSLGIVDSNATQLITPTPSDSAEMTHILPREANGIDTVSWPFWYQAPLTAGITDTLYANSNTVNLNGDPKGDEWTFAPNVLIQVTPAEGVHEEPVPLSFQLSQNYPNPFNPLTIINYQLSIINFVSLKIYDLLGREVATLVEGELPAGSHRVSFDASGFSGGVYFYKLQAGSFTETRKMLLLK